MKKFLLIISKMLITATIVCCWQVCSLAQTLASVEDDLSAPHVNTKDGIAQQSGNTRSLKEFLKELEIKFQVSFHYLGVTVREKLVSPEIEIGSMEGEEIEGYLRQILDPLALIIEKADDHRFIIYAKKQQGKKIKKLKNRALKQEGTLRNPKPEIQQGAGVESRSKPGFEQTISGKVTSDNGEPLPGVNILAKGTTIGSITDSEGNYKVIVPDETTILVFSYVGYVTEEIEIGGKTVIDMVLVQDISTLTEVVVTAFGIEKQKKALTYAAQEVSGEDVGKVNNPNILNGLQGKVAGVVIRQISGAPGSTPEIRIRGNRSVRSGNDPIYVIDGQIINGRPQDIDPKSIETINVLKGPNAAALYGILASNGAIVITTKKGADQQPGKAVVNFETGYNVDQVTRLPDNQEIYGQGIGGDLNLFTPFSWGPRIDTLGVYTNQLGEQEEASVYDNDKDFFVTGGTYNANLSVEKRMAEGNYAIGGSYTRQEGVVERTDFERFNFKFAGNYNISPKITVGASVNSSFTESNEVTPRGNSSLFYAAYFAPPSYDLGGKPIAQPDDPFAQINYRNAHDNIYWSVRNNSDNDEIIRTFGNVNIQYKPSDWISVNYRFGDDYFLVSTKRVLALGSGATGGRTNPPGGGSIIDILSYNNTINSNLNVNMTKGFGDFDFNLLVGSDFFHRRSRTITSVGNNIIVGGFDNIANTSIQTTEENISRRRIVGFYGNLEANWKSTLFLNLTGRNDLVSNLPSNDRSFFYPSIGLGLVFSEILQLPEKSLTFGKIRASYAESGQAGSIYVQNEVFTNTPIGAGHGAGSFEFPFNGVNAFTQSGRLIADDLVTENTRTYEVGLDVRFLNNRVGVDYTYFNTLTDNQIFDVPIALSTGFSTETRNAGEISSVGHEVVLNATLLKGDGFSWDLTTNFTTYKNKVESLGEGIESLRIGGFRTQIVLEPGEDYPVLRGSGYARGPASGEQVMDSRAVLPNGNPNPSYGMPLEDPDTKILGSAVPDFQFGFMNTVRYKGLTLSVQIDWREGGVISSGFNRLGKLYGVLDQTENRTQEILLPGKKGFYDEQGNLVVEGDNDVAFIPGEQYFRRVLDRIRESNVYDASFVRLRELSLSYDLPSAWLEKTGLGAATVYFTGRNLALKSNVPHADPEESTWVGEQYLTYPQIKSFGAGLRIKL